MAGERGSRESEVMRWRRLSHSRGATNIAALVRGEVTAARQRRPTGLVGRTCRSAVTSPPTSEATPAAPYVRLNQSPSKGEQEDRPTVNESPGSSQARLILARPSTRRAGGRRSNRSTASEAPRIERSAAGLSLWDSKPAVPRAQASPGRPNVPTVKRKRRHASAVHNTASESDASVSTRTNSRTAGFLLRHTSLTASAWTATWN
jgi:hypothetical protein